MLTLPSLAYAGMPFRSIHRLLVNWCQYVIGMVQNNAELVITLAKLPLSLIQSTRVVSSWPVCWTTLH